MKTLNKISTHNFSQIISRFTEISTGFRYISTAMFTRLLLLQIYLVLEYASACHHHQPCNGYDCNEVGSRRTKGRRDVWEKCIFKQINELEEGPSGMLHAVVIGVEEEEDYYTLDFNDILLALGLREVCAEYPQICSDLQVCVETNIKKLKPPKTTVESTKKSTKKSKNEEEEEYSERARAASPRLMIGGRKSGNTNSNRNHPGDTHIELEARHDYGPKESQHVQIFEGSGNDLNIEGLLYEEVSSKNSLKVNTEIQRKREKRIRERKRRQKQQEQEKLYFFYYPF